jgi:putative transposase
MMITVPLEAGNFYHIYNRGNNSEPIFLNENNYAYFLGLIDKYVYKVADVYCYCLLNNHFHLLVRIKENQSSKAASQCFSNLFNAYAKAFNKFNNRTGKLFEERFKRKKVHQDSYFTELIYYIHTNPQRHRIVEDFRTYHYSSFKVCMSSKRSKLRKNEVIDWFAGKTFFEQYHLQRIQYIMDYESFDSLTS